jgi:hypothetical protein
MLLDYCIVGESAAVYEIYEVLATQTEVQLGIFVKIVKGVDFTK